MYNNCCSITNVFSKKCKNIANIEIKSNCYCLTHAKLYYSSYCVKIQKHYRGHKQRKIINAIYNKLPDDIQRLIINFVRQDHYINKYYKSINNIITKKVEKLYFNKYRQNIRCVSFSDINNVYYLSSKYFKIIDYTILKYIYEISRPLEEYLLLLIPNEFLNNDIANMTSLYNQYYKLFQLINFENITFEDVFTLLQHLRHYCYVYDIKSIFVPTLRI